MSAKVIQIKDFEMDIYLIRSMFCHLLKIISPKERRRNFRLQRKAQFAIWQLGLCRELARSLDGN